MDVNAIVAQKAAPAFFAAFPVERAPAIETKQVEPVPKSERVLDTIVIDLNVQERATYQSALEIRSVEQARSGLRVFRDETTERFVFEILNANNEEIRQFPSDEELRIFTQFINVTGALFDHQA
jgi:hypothetical protein